MTATITEDMIDAAEREMVRHMLADVDGIPLADVTEADVDAAIAEARESDETGPEQSGLASARTALRDMLTAAFTIGQSRAADQVSVYLVWSTGQHSWWGPNGHAYTGDVWLAGRYDDAEARKACGMRTWSAGQPPPEVMVLAPEHGVGPMTAEEIRVVPAVMRQRIADATQARLAERDAGRPADAPEEFAAR